MFDHTCNFRIPNTGQDIEELELEMIDFGVEEIFADEVHTTFMHELGHFLGLDEDDLYERGLE